MYQCPRFLWSQTQGGFFVVQSDLHSRDSVASIVGCRAVAKLADTCLAAASLSLVPSETMKAAAFKDERDTEGVKPLEISRWRLSRAIISE